MEFLPVGGQLEAVGVAFDPVGGPFGPVGVRLGKGGGQIVTERTAGTTWEAKSET